MRRSEVNTSVFQTRFSSLRWSGITFFLYFLLKSQELQFGRPHAQSRLLEDHRSESVLLVSVVVAFM